MRETNAGINGSVTENIRKRIINPESIVATLEILLFGMLPGLRVVRDIFASWLITLPVGAVMAIVFFFTLKGIFGTSCIPCN